MKIIKATILFITVSVLGYSQPISLDSLLFNSMKEANIPGMAISKIDSGQVSWEKYSGYSDIENKVHVTPKTSFLLSSVSKTITAAALMKLHGEGKLRLDDDISGYLDFDIKNPNFPTEKITFRHLLRHRSSINDNYQYLMPFWLENNGDSGVELKTFLRNYLTVEGENYNAENFTKAPPGSYFNYSNIGFALVGLLVQEISGIPFKDYCQKSIFDKLGMNNSKWFLEDLNKNIVAKQYQTDSSTNELEFVGFSGFPDFPAGQLRSTVKDYSNFLITWMNNGIWDNQQIFDPKSIFELTPADFMLGTGFHTWFLYNPSKEEIVYSHFGSDKGSFAFVAYNAWSKKAIIVIINSSVDDDKKRIVYDMIDKLYNEY